MNKLSWIFNHHFSCDSLSCGLTTEGLLKCESHTHYFTIVIARSMVNFAVVLVLIIRVSSFSFFSLGLAYSLNKQFSEAIDVSTVA